MSIAHSILLVLAVDLPLTTCEFISIPLKKVSTKSDTSHRRLDQIVYNNVPLGLGIGTHYAELYIGLPPQPASVILDTGSEITAIPCSECMSCGTHTDPYFNFTKSSTIRYATCQEYRDCTSCTDQRCHIAQGYTEGSAWEAVVINDLVWVGGFSSSNIEFLIRHFGFRFSIGCQTRETGLFVSQKENGIMGLGRSKKTIVHAMVESNRIKDAIFSLCFGDAGGNFVMGGLDYSRHTSKVTYTKLYYHTSLYVIRLKDVRVNNESIGVDSSLYASGRGTIVDSGTTDTYLPTAAESAFKTLYYKHSGIEYATTNMRLKKETVLPIISFVFGDMNGGDFEILLDNARIMTYSTIDIVGMNLFFTERSGVVLGANTITGYDVVFDVQRKRIGFASANCTSEHSDGSTIILPPPILASDKKLSPTSSVNGMYIQIGIIASVSILLVFFILLTLDRRAQFRARRRAEIRARLRPNLEQESFPLTRNHSEEDDVV